MSAEKNLFNAYTEWIRLAKAEAEAIDSSNWELLNNCQDTALAKLQPNIVALTAAARREWSQPGVDKTAKEKKLRDIVQELIQLKNRNAELLNERCAAMKEQVNQLNQASRNLKQIRQSYSAPSPKGWSSFS